MRLYNTLTRQQEAFVPVRDAHRPHVHLRPDRLRARPHRQLPDLRLRGRVAPRAEVRGRLPDASRHELHRRRRQDHHRRGEGGPAAARIHRSDTSTRFARMRRPSASSRWKRRRGPPIAANLQAMAGMINALGERGHTYTSEGSIYFKISTLPAYGKLARLDHEGIQSGARVDSDEYDKENARDFVLWKATKPDEPTWDCRLRARAGPAGTSSARRWRCGCSASRRSTSTPAASIWCFRITRTRSRRAKAPRARSSRASGSTSSTCWSTTRRCRSRLGNFYTRAGRARQRAFACRRCATSCCRRYYRKQLNFTWTGLEQAEEALRRITDFLGRVEALTSGGAHAEVTARVTAAVDAFDGALRDDLNTAAGLGAMFDLIRALNIAMDNKGGGQGRRCRTSSPRSPTSIACSACCRCAALKTPRRRSRWPRSTRPSMPARRRAAARDFARGRSHSPGAARERRHPRRQSPRARDGKGSNATI